MRGTRTEHQHSASPLAKVLLCFMESLIQQLWRNTESAPHFD
jgi:hypothetical protein